MWKATFEHQAPPSGEMPEQHFSAEIAESSRWVWVKFASEAGDVWFASFRAGRVRQQQGIATPDGLHVFVLVGGVCYCVDAEARRLRGILPGNSFGELLPIPETATIAIASFDAVVIASAFGPIWSTPRIAWDGIRLIHADRDEVRGVAEGPSDECAFTINLASGQVVGGHSSDFARIEAADAEFRVNHHFEIQGRGVFVAGDILRGRLAVGDSVILPLPVTPLTVGAVEISDHRVSGKSEFCLRFQESPSKYFLEQLLPAGSVVRFRRAA